MNSALICIILLTISSLVFSDNPYCTAKCQRLGEHMLCKNEPCLVQCEHSSFKEPDNRFRDTFLHLLNDVRSRVASGRVSLPEASNMRVLSWDRELEFMAQCLLNSCGYEMASPLEPECLVTLDNGTMVRTIRKDFTLPLGAFMGNDNVETVMKSWRPTNETITHIDSFPPKLSQHYKDNAQLIWADTTNVGCAQRSFIENTTFTRTVTFCNFAPGGLQPNQSIYKKGKSCIDSGLTENPTYPGLCGQIRSQKADPFQPPFEIEQLYAPLINDISTHLSPPKVRSNKEKGSGRALYGALPTKIDSRRTAPGLAPLTPLFQRNGFGEPVSVATPKKRGKPTSRRRYPIVGERGGPIMHFIEEQTLDEIAISTGTVSQSKTAKTQRTTDDSTFEWPPFVTANSSERVLLSKKLQGYGITRRTIETTNWRLAHKRPEQGPFFYFANITSTGKNRILDNLHPVMELDNNEANNSDFALPERACAKNLVLNPFLPPVCFVFVYFRMNLMII